MFQQYSLLFAKRKHQTSNIHRLHESSLSTGKKITHPTAKSLLPTIGAPLRWLAVGVLMISLSACKDTAQKNAFTLSSTIDNTAPTVSLSSPGSTISGIVTLTATSSDNVGVAGVQFLLDGSAMIGSEDTSSPYSVTWDTTATSNNTHSLTAVARDQAGNLATSQPVTVTVSNSTPQPPGDTTKPTVSFNTPSDASTVSGTVTVSANASDNVGVTGVQFLIDNNRLLSDTAGPFSFSWDTTQESDGTHTLSAIARDAAGNLSLTASRSVTVSNDTTAPSASLSAPSNGATVSATVTVSATATDNVGVAGVQFKLDGSNLGAEDTAAPYSVSWDTTGIANGAHTLTAVARDLTGNTGTAINVTVTVSNDSTAPSVSVSAPANGAIISGSVTVSANATDNVGVTGVQFKLNGSNLGAEDSAAPFSISWDTSLVSDGSYNLSAVAFDAAGNSASSTSVNVTVNNSQPPTPGPTKFPLHVETGKRYLVDANNNPFFLNGEAAWGLIDQLTTTEVDQYLDDRSQKGVNTILVMLIAHHIYISNSPNNANGDAPFLTAGDFSTPNETYFAHADWVINRAAQKGFLVLLVPAYTGYLGTSQEGWYPDMVTNGVDKLRAYGNYVATRYANFSNVVWVEGGDFNPPTAGKDLVRAVANGIGDVIANPVQTFHGDRGTAAMQFWGTTEPWLTLNDIYTDKNTIVSKAFGEYSRSTAPFFLIEAIYENEGADEVLVRTQAYQAILSGGFGHVMGNKDIWRFTAGTSGWVSQLDSPGSLSFRPLRTLFESRNWWLLQPDTNSTFLTAGISAYSDQAAASLASDGSFAMVYLPSIRTVTLDLSKLAGPNVRAQWCDPTNAVCADISGSPFPNTGTQDFTPGGNNATNTGDWVLMLDSQP